MTTSKRARAPRMRPTTAPDQKMALPVRRRRPETEIDGCLQTRFTTYFEASGRPYRMCAGVVEQPESATHANVLLGASSRPHPSGDTSRDLQLLDPEHIEVAELPFPGCHFLQLGREL